MDSQVMENLFKKRAAAVMAHLDALRASANFYERQKLNISNQQLPLYIESIKKAILFEVGKGILADAFMEDLERQIGPTPGKSILERWAEYLARMRRNGEGTT